MAAETGVAWRGVASEHRGLQFVNCDSSLTRHQSVGVALKASWNKFGNDNELKYFFYLFLILGLSGSGCPHS